VQGSAPRAGRPARVVAVNASYRTLTLDCGQRPRPNFPLNLPVKRGREIHNKKRKKGNKKGKTDKGNKETSDKSMYISVSGLLSLVPRSAEQGAEYAAAKQGAGRRQSDESRSNRG